jgi:chromosome segregation ATPase
MTTVTESDLKKLEDKIDKLTETLNLNQQIIEGRFNNLEKSQLKLETELKGLSNQLTDYKDQTSKRFDDVINRINDTNGRLNTMSLGFFGIVGVLVAGLLAIIGKVLFFPQV